MRVIGDVRRISSCEVNEKLTPEEVAAFRAATTNEERFAVLNRVAQDVAEQEGMWITDYEVDAWVDEDDA